MDKLLTDPDIGLMIWTWVSFGIMAFILAKFAWQPMVHALEAREHHIQEEIDRAEANRAESARLLADHQAKLEASRLEAQKIIEEGKADAVRLKDQILKEAREEGERLVKGAKREIELAESKAVETLRQKTVELAVAAASRILERTLRPEDHKDVVNRFLQETERSLSQRSA